MKISNQCVNGVSDQWRVGPMGCSHKSHTRGLKALIKATDVGIIVVSLPSHCSDKMQPLDLGTFKSFKTYYSQEIDTWMRANPGRRVMMDDITRLFGKAYMANLLVLHWQLLVSEKLVFGLRTEMF
jgi:hypothetical protein